MAKPTCVRSAGESSAAIGLQVLLPFLLSGLGMVGAGMVLDAAQVSPTAAHLQHRGGSSPHGSQAWRKVGRRMVGIFQHKARRMDLVLLCVVQNAFYLKDDSFCFPPVLNFAP